MQSPAFYLALSFLKGSFLSLAAQALKKPCGICKHTQSPSKRRITRPRNLRVLKALSSEPSTMVI